MANLSHIIAADQQQRQEFKAEKQAEREELTSAQDAAVMAITTSPAAYRAYLELQAQNPTISAGNVALVWTAGRDATMVGTIERWNRLGRSVQRGETGIKILIPEKYRDEKGVTRTGYRVGRVFDVSQTHGQRLPPQVQLQEGTAEFEKGIAALLSQSPVPVEPQEDFVDVSYYDPANKRILIQDGMGDAQTFAALAQEVAHAKFHASYGDAYQREYCETDAESIRYMLCRRFGIASELPAAGDLQTLYAEQVAGERRSGLSYLQACSETMGNRVMQSLNPPQRERQGQEQHEK